MSLHNYECFVHGSSSMNGVGISFTPLFFTSIIIALFVSAAQTSFALLDWRLVLLLHKVICSSVHRMNVP